MTFHDTDTPTTPNRPSSVASRVRAVFGEMHYANKRLFEIQTSVPREPRA